jgi:predicted transcriptional regulator
LGRLLLTGGFISTALNGRFANMAGMTKLLEQAIAKVRRLSAEDQDAFTVALLSMAGEERPMMHLDEETRAAVRDGLAQAKRGELVREEEMAAFFKQHGL